MPRLTGWPFRPRSPRGRLAWPESAGLLSARQRLLFLLERADLLERHSVADVGDGAERAVLAVGAGRLLPPRWTDVQLLTEQRDEDLRLLPPEPRQREQT